jgi:signal transduction histidine kinase
VKSSPPSGHGIPQLTLSARPVDAGSRRAAALLAVLSAATFLAFAPIAKVPLGRVDWFIPLFQSTLIINDSITAALLFAQLRFSQQRAILVLASGYVFAAAMATVHMLTFPGVFSSTGLLGAGTQTTGYLHTLWHTGVPVAVVAYTVLRRAETNLTGGVRAATAQALLIVALLVCGLTLLTTWGHGLLPPMLTGVRYSATFNVARFGAWAATGLAMVILWRLRPRSVLDLWLLVMLWDSFLEIALVGIINAGRYDVGFYAGRVYAMLASSVVLVMLLAEHGKIYRELAGARELESAARELAEANAMKSQFLAHMSHELRTPLNAIIGFSEVLRDGLAGKLNERQQEFAGEILRAGKHLLDLVNDVLDLSKIESGRMVIDASEVDVAALVHDSMAVLREAARTKRVSLHAEVESALPPLAGDWRRLRQVLYNLVSNAVKFTAEGGTVKVSARRVERAAVAAHLAGAFHPALPLTGEASCFCQLSVEDSGIGIEASDIARLFEPFTQIDGTLSRQHHGTGLGLALVKSLVALHRGCVAIASEPGKGSCVVVWLPWPEPEADPSRLRGLS